MATRLFKIESKDKIYDDKHTLKHIAINHAKALQQNICKNTILYIKSYDKATGGNEKLEDIIS
jgi:hypothetical protein